MYLNAIVSLTTYLYDSNSLFPTRAISQNWYYEFHTVDYYMLNLFSFMQLGQGFICDCMQVSLMLSNSVID